MGNGLHALGNDFTVEGAGQADHALDDGQVVGVGLHVAHKALVDLDDLGTEAFEVGERRVARAKVVQRKAHAHGLAAAHDVGHQGDIFQRAGLQDFQLQVAGGHLGLCGQQCGQAKAETLFCRCCASMFTLTGRSRPWDCHSAIWCRAVAITQSPTSG